MPCVHVRRYTNIYVGTPSLTDNFQTVEITPQVLAGIHSKFLLQPENILWPVDLFQ